MPFSLPPSLPWVAWNCELAMLPVILGYAAARLGHRARARGGSLWAGFALVLTLWLLFLPNTCYLFTEWRHFLEFVEANNLALSAKQDQGLLFIIAARGLFYLAYAGFGALCLTFAIRPIERLLRAWHFSFPIVAPALFLLLSLGVYLGLVLRFNSWDAWHHPRYVWSAVKAIPTMPRLVLAIFIFALLLWGIYEALDLWADGIVARIRVHTARWRHRNQPYQPYQHEQQQRPAS